VAESQRQRTGPRRRKDRLSVSGEEGFALEELRLPGALRSLRDRTPPEQGNHAFFGRGGGLPALRERVRISLSALRGNERMPFIALFVSAALLVLGLSFVRSRSPAVEPERSVEPVSAPIARDVGRVPPAAPAPPAALGPSVTPGEAIPVAIDRRALKEAAPGAKLAATVSAPEPAPAPSPAAPSGTPPAGSTLSVLERPIAPPEE
jgi:hypothetical protein